MVVDHIVPESVGCPTGEANHWLAYPLCNAHECDRIAVLNANTDEIVRLLDPRQQTSSRSARQRHLAGARSVGAPRTRAITFVQLFAQVQAEAATPGAGIAAIARPPRPRMVLSCAFTGSASRTSAA